MYRTIPVLLAFIASVAFTSLGIAGKSKPLHDNGFLTDYSLLQGEEVAGGMDYAYIAPDVFNKIAKYNAVMVDQPEVFLSPDSKYKGAKPDNLKALADAIRQQISSRLQDKGYHVVDAPGPDVMYLRLALTDLYLKKKKKGLLAYTPVGIVATTAAGAMIDNMMKKVDIVEMSIEVEATDSATGEMLAAIVINRGARKDKAAGQKKDTRIDFDEFSGIVQEYGARIACRLDNARLPEDQRVDCKDPAARTAG